MLGNIITAGFLFTLNMLVLTFAGIVRMLPAFFRAMRQVLRLVLLLSVRLYRLIFAHIAPFLWRFLHINITTGLAKVMADILLSLLFGLLLLVIIPLPITWITLGICGVHGLLVGLAGEETASRDNLNLGEDME
jgi:hypothetical protein